MQVTRRQLFEVGGLVVVAGVSTAAGYYGRGVVNSTRDAVTGFEWSDQDFPPFRDDSLRNGSPLFGRDPNAGSGPNDKSRTVAIIGTAAAEAVTRLAATNTRLGLAYTDPGGEWHQGAGQVGQLYG